MASTTRSPATKKRKAIDLPIAQFIAIIVLSISIFLIIDFGRRAAAGYRIRREQETLRAQMVKLEQTHQTLLAKRAFVESDAYVEATARQHLKWSRPGETIVVVMATPRATARPLGPLPPRPEEDRPETPLQSWVDRFFTLR